MLQCNAGETSDKYYKNQGFKNVTKFPSSFYNNEKEGQFIHIINEQGMKIMLLDQFPLEPQYNLSPGISLKCLFGNKNKRIKQNDLKSGDENEAIKSLWLVDDIVKKKIITLKRLLINGQMMMHLAFTNGVQQ